ncbi:ligand-dependent corepressor [Pungitius pungitius]|uniref:ligand-dependent corepressor n=1 Tax=Pungitius pungitius TaxID=134920 RepID=UPI002E105E2E
MASLCKRQQCTVERRGFRQELDSWRHKLIHCVGFESILEGLFGPGLVNDFTLFQDCEPEEVSDWSFDDNCLFCCLRREKVKERGAEKGGGSQVLTERSRISRLERQAQDFLNAVFHKKDLPSFSEPHIPLVAREIMQRMIRQFAAEYTSKTTQDASPAPNGAMKDQSLPRAASLAAPPCSPPGPTPSSPRSSASSSSSSSSSSSPPLSPITGPSLSPASAIKSISGVRASNGERGGGGTAAASAQNPVLSKLLMNDQDGPLDLSLKKSEMDADPSQQDGVLDLSTKKNSSSAAKPKTSSAEPGAKRHSIKVEDTPPEEDEGVLLQRSPRDRLRETYVNSTSYKPPMARSLRIKEELLSQKQRLLSQPTALSLANLESAGLLSHVQSFASLGQKGSSSFWGSKAHLESLVKLKQASGALSGALSDLKDLPAFLENHHNHHGAFSFKSSVHHHHNNQASKAQHHHGDGKRDQGHSPPVDLKIPQVRGMDLSWDSHGAELYGYGAAGVGGGVHGENILSRKLRAILPKQNRRGGSLGSLLDGAADYWSSDLDHGGSGPAYSTSDAEGDPNSKQPRKKRGRYRQYNTDILEEAITVVMSGKMSVSKAQNMYGIPHSTLEYKVKERLGTLKNPPKKKLKLMMKTEAGGSDFALAESESAAGATPRDAAPPAAGAERGGVKEEVDDHFKPID